MTENFDDFLEQLKIADIKRDGSDKDRADLPEENDEDLEGAVSGPESDDSPAPKPKRKYRKRLLMRTKAGDAKIYNKRSAATPYMKAPPKGTPEYEEYRQKALRGEIMHKGPRFLTDDEIAVLKDKKRARMRKQWREESRKKYHKKRAELIAAGVIIPAPRKPYVRKKYAGHLTYSEASDVAQYELIHSAAYYRMWYNDNKPSNMPYKPEEFYKDEWQGWGHFLGKPANSWPKVGGVIRWRRYYESKAYIANKPEIRSKEDWFTLVKSGTVPPDIPTRPDLVYRRTGEWTSWPQFLRKSTDITVRPLDVDGSKLYFYMLRVKQKNSDSAFRVGVTKGGKSSIRDAVIKYDLEYFGAWEVPDTFDYKTFCKYFGEERWDAPGVWDIPEYMALISRLGYMYNIKTELEVG